MTTFQTNLLKLLASAGLFGLWAAMIFLKLTTLPGAGEFLLAVQASLAALGAVHLYGIVPTSSPQQPGPTP